MLDLEKIQYAFAGEIKQSTANKTHLIVISCLKQNPSNQESVYSLVRFNLLVSTCPIDDLRLSFKGIINGLYSFEKTALITSDKGTFIINNEWKKMIEIKYKLNINSIIQSNNNNNNNTNIINSSITVCSENQINTLTLSTDFYINGSININKEVN